jgi:hypothetical protein
MRQMCRSRYLLFLASTLLCGPVLGQSAPDVVQDRQDDRVFKNPFARMFAFWFEFDTARPIGDHSRVQNLFKLTSIIPIPLGTKWDLITKSAISGVSQPDLMNPRGSAWKLSDLTTSAYFSPNKKGTLQWGLGTTFLLPTATGQEVGNGKWGAGPGGAIFAEPGKWTLGLEISDLKSFAGDRTRPDVHYASLQYFVTYNISKGWYLTTQPQTSADWTVSREDRWLMPVALGVGKAVTVRKRQVSVEFDGYYNLVHPTTLAYPKWVLTLQVTFARRNVL